MKTSATYRLPLTLLALLLSNTLATAGERRPELRSSPDGQAFVCWFDHHGDAPVGETRSILLRSESDPDMPVFSFVGFSRFTDAAWNSASTRCVIVNEVDWERTLVWLVCKDESGKWHERRLDVVAPIKAVYHQAIGNKDHPGFRLHLDKSEWISGTQLRFSVRSNGNDPDLDSSGTYQVEINAELPDAKPTMTKVSFK